MSTPPPVDPENCKCPRCRPRDWMVADLVTVIRERDDVLDELITAGELVVLYNDDRSLGRLRNALAGWREASGDSR